MASGFRSFPPVPVGISMLRPGASVRCYLAFWIGGACVGFVPVPPIPPEPVPSVLVSAEGLPFAKHERRPPIDDTEVLEFLQMWTLWNDIE